VIVVKPPKEELKPRALLVLDVDDHIDPASRTWITLDDQGNPARPSEVEERAGELGLRFEGWLLEQGDLEPDQERLLKMVGEQIKANAATLDGFGVERFVNPPFSFRGGLNRAVTVFGGQQQLETVLSNLNQTVFVRGDA
jgi:type I restriction enzyme, R subunit